MCIDIDKIWVAIVTCLSFLLQLTKTAESADSDDKTFSSYVEMLKQKGHVMDSSSTLHNMVKSYVLISIIINVKSIRV